ncbi:EAL and HDOD domain-containing protein [Pseudoalteromonas aurantia]|uniref:EAL domain-containing protein n=1 Tax=Pseudoalteromonas aurantia TaxID=43654 RepID=A0A5S3V6M1_9GAMM|nr:HDOD domain-containing protein [Pseudoalteromonas aurantia]TMO62566.1 EAL domain-containing protein [Pseudoalteromonas aurantia]TMO66882.1 EAL domain-containing protein [Pseudoalteromonas aurantia]TMO76268.1 EAL domain-containing protein [Pseudoalteromonas aurantia]
MYFYAARQPILDINKELVGYELLFRDGVDNVFPNIDGDEATSRLIEGSQFNFGLDDLTDNKPAYINFTLETILKGYPTMLSREQVVIEILETVQPGKRLLAAVQNLKDKGYTIALDDYQHQKVWRHFYPFVDQIKVDFLTTSHEKIVEIIDATKSFSNIKLVAEKVETYEQYQQAIEWGFSLFQGFFFAKPEMVQSKALPPSEMALAELLYETSSVNVDLQRITGVFERDVNLSYKLLRYSNSAAFKRRAEISTIKQALVVLGNAELKKFLSLLFAAQVSAEKPMELIKLSLTRARFCELLATRKHDKHHIGTAFLTGMMSLMDAILDETMDSVMNKLPLVIEIKDALLEAKGTLADYLSIATEYEQAQWDKAQGSCNKMNLDPACLPEIYNEAVSWSNEQMQVIER